MPATEPVYLTLDGESVRLSDREGEVVLLTWWATWCGACRKEMPEVVALHEELSARGLRVIGAAVNGRNEAELVRRAMAELGMDFEVWLWANANDMAHHGLGPELPASIVVDDDGRVVERIRGALDREALRPLLRRLLEAGEGSGVSSASLPDGSPDRVEDPKGR